MELIKQRIWSVRNQAFPSNSYLLKSESSKDCLIIDPGLDAELIDTEISNLGLKPVAILATHGHFDHIGSVDFFKRKFNVPYFLHEADLRLSKAANFYLKMARLEMVIATPVPDVLWTLPTQSVRINDFDLLIHNLPGHSNGSCVIQYDKYLFSGDIIYKKGLGFNNFPGEDKLKLKESILRIFETFLEQSIILPGHGESESLGEIRKNNEELIKFLSN